MESDPNYRLDHLVVAARTVEEGAAWVKARLGADMVAGGKHAMMGTHNRLLSLGDRQYLEVIAVDPEASPPARPRWFLLDDEAMRRRLAEGPALVHWVARAADMEAIVRARGNEEVLEMARGDLRWRIGVARDGSLPPGGEPTLIEWLGGGHPGDRLPGSACRLRSFARPAAGASLRFATPAGEVELPWTRLR